MNDQKVSNNVTSFVIAFIALILGGTIGWGMTRAAVNSGPGTAPPTVGIGGGPTDEAASTSIALPLNNLLKDHTNLLNLHLQAQFDGRDTDPTAKQLDANTQELTKLFSILYGQNTAEMFLTMWQDQIAQYSLYTEGLKVNDKTKMSQAKERLAQISVEAGDMLHNLNQNIGANEVTDQMQEQVNLTLAIIDAHARNDQVNLIAQTKLATDQSADFANYLNQKISRNQPTVRPQ